MASPVLDTDAKQCRPSAGQAQLSRVRADYNRIVVFSVVLEGISIGAMGHRTYLLVAATAGTHLLVSFTGEHQANLSGVVAPGRNDFVRLFPQLGWMCIGLESTEKAEGCYAVSVTSCAAGVGL